MHPALRHEDAHTAVIVSSKCGHRNQTILSHKMAKAFNRWRSRMDHHSLSSMKMYRLPIYFIGRALSRRCGKLGQVAKHDTCRRVKLYRSSLRTYACTKDAPLSRRSVDDQPMYS